MPKNDQYFTTSIRDFLVLESNEEAGEAALAELISGFSCPQNAEVERFLKKSAIEFTKKSQSVTYLVLSCADKSLLGYFSLAIKPLTVRSETVSNTVKKKLSRISELDKRTNAYNMSAYLIAQLGKNYAINEGKLIDGNDLLKMAWSKIKDAQYICGGVVAFLEAERKDKLLAFYEENRFKQFDARRAKSDTNKPHELVQMLRLL